MEFSGDYTGTYSHLNSCFFREYYIREYYNDLTDSINLFVTAKNLSKKVNKIKTIYVMKLFLAVTIITGSKSSDFIKYTTNRNIIH